MTATPEGKILAKLLKFARVNGIKYIRLALQPYVETGWPDVVFLLPHGASYWMEIKRHGKEPTPKQLEKLHDLSNLDFVCGWFDDADKAIAALTSAMETIAVYDARRRVSARTPSSGSASGPGGSQN